MQTNPNPKSSQSPQQSPHPHQDLIENLPAKEDEGEQFCVLIEDGSSDEGPRKHGQNPARNPQEQCKLHIHKRLKKFNALADAYRKHQPHLGKEPKISERRQAHTPQKKSVANSPLLIKRDPDAMVNVWNPYILPHDQSMSQSPYAIVDEFLASIKKWWPEELCRFNEEIALQYLRGCSYFPDLALRLLQEETGQDFLDSLCTGNVNKDKMNRTLQGEEGGDTGTSRQTCTVSRERSLIIELMHRRISGSIVAERKRGPQDKLQNSVSLIES